MEPDEIEVYYSSQEVELIDHMGTDLSVVNAARVSFSKESTEFTNKDAKLIKYLAKHNHWSPFAHTAIQLRLKAPIFIARQLVKHQVGGVWNEVSRRYVSDTPEFFGVDAFRAYPEGTIKQGSAGDLPKETQDIVQRIYHHQMQSALETYEALLDRGVAPEQARTVLPQSTMTEWYWTGSLMFWARVCKQRLDAHAQKEAQEIAQIISDIMQELYPVAWEALMENTNADD